MDSRELFKTPDAATHLKSDEAMLRLVLDDPRYFEPALSSVLHFLSFRLMLDRWHDTAGGETEVFGVYAANEATDEQCILRHVVIERGAFGSFDLHSCVTVNDTEINRSLIEAIEREYANQELPAIGAGSAVRTNTNYIEVEWFYNRTYRQAGWALPNESLQALSERLRELADKFRALDPDAGA